VLSAGGNWDRVFTAGAAITIVAAILAKFLLAPMRKKFIEGANAAKAAAEGISAVPPSRPEAGIMGIKQAG
jgi:OFA family oxalate/formate antiporter-like MFS transporter